jgi:predicted RNA-binding protein
MKKIIQLFALCLILTSCDFQKVTELQDDFEIKVSAEPVFSKVNLKVFNAKDGSEITQNLELSFSGADADKIYTVNGTKDYKIDNGFITLGINRNTNVTADNPLRATAVVKANGFITKTQDINFDGSDIQEVQISLLERENLPENIVLESVTKTLVDNKTTEEIVVEATSKTDGEQSVGVTIPEGAQFEDEDGNLVTGGEVTVDLQTFEIEEPDFESFTEDNANPEQLPAGLNEFPGDFTLGEDEPTTSNKSYAKKEVLNNGTYLVPIRSQPCLYVYVNGRRVWWRGASGRNMKIRTLIYSWTNNPNTGQRIKVGDKIAVYRRVGNRNVKLTDAFVQSYPWSSRYVQITFNIPGSGIYPYGFEVTPGCNQQSINNITFKNEGRRTFYWYSVAHKSNPRRALRWGYMYFNGTYQVNRRNYWYWNNRALNMLKDDMRLTVYYYNRQERKVKVAYQKEISKCDLEGQTINIENKECYEERDLNLSLACPDATYLLNNVYVYYKKENDRWWSYFDRVRYSRLDGKSPCFEPGVKYQFGFWYGGWKVTPPLTEDEMLELYQNFDLPTICNAIRNL